MQVPCSRPRISYAPAHTRCAYVFITEVGENVTEHLEELRAELGWRIRLVGLQGADQRQHVRVATCQALRVAETYTSAAPNA